MKTEKINYTTKFFIFELNYASKFYFENFWILEPNFPKNKYLGSKIGKVNVIIELCIFELV